MDSVTQNHHISSNKHLLPKRILLAQVETISQQPTSGIKSGTSGIYS